MDDLKPVAREILREAGVVNPLDYYTGLVFEIRSPQSALIEVYSPARQQIESPSKLQLARLSQEHLPGPQKAN